MKDVLKTLEEIGITEPLKDHFQALSLKLSCKQCGTETPIILPLYISKKDWIKTVQILTKLDNGFKTVDTIVKVNKKKTI